MSPRPAHLALLLLFLTTACQIDDDTPDAGPDADPTDADATNPDTDPTDTDPPDTDPLIPIRDATPPPDLGPDAAPGDTAGLRFEPVFPNDMWTQLHPLYQRLGATASERARGRLHLELCPEPDCPDPLVLRLGETDFGPFGSVNGPPGASIQRLTLPARDEPWHARLFLDTTYSRNIGASVGQEGGAGNFDIYASGGALDAMPCQSIADCVNGSIIDGHNPPPITLELTLQNDEITDLGRIVFGSVVAAIDTPKPAPANGYLLVAASGTAGRNAIYAIDERDHTVEEGDLTTLAGQPFQGDFCGFVRGAADDLWVLGFSARDGHIFRYDTRARAFTDTPPITIPAPVGNDARVSLCRGVFIERADRDYLVLIEFEGAGALDTAQTYPLAIIDITDPINPITTTYATGQGIFAGDTPEVSPVLRGIATDGTHAYVITPSWRTRTDGRSRLYTLALDPATGAPTRLHTVDAGLAEDRCNSTLHFVPALAVASMARVGVAPTPHVFVGTDTHLHIYDAATLANATAEAPIARIDTTAYGTLPATLAQGIEDNRLYVMPNCKSTTPAVLNGRPTNRHAVAILDLTSDPRAPLLLETDRRFDDINGGPTGGIDLAYLSIKRGILRWYEDGVLPPVTYTGPQITVGPTALYLRGAGVSLANDAPEDLRAAGVSGLGQAGDIGVMDLATGEGSISRPDYTIWFDGPSAEWGLKLRPLGVAGASTGAMIRVAGE